MATFNYDLSFLRTNPIFYPNVTDIYYTTDVGQEGFWRYDPGDNTSNDNTGLVIVTMNNSRLKRIFDGLINVKWFGVKGDAFPENINPTNDTINIQKAINAMQIYYSNANSNNVNQTISESSGGLFFPAGFYLIDTIYIHADNTTQDLKWNGETLRVNLIGSGIMSTVFVGNSNYFPSELNAQSCGYIAKRNLIQIENPYTNLKDFSIIGSPYIEGAYCYQVLCEIPTFYGPGYEFVGIYAEACAFLNIERVFIRSCDTGIKFTGVLTSNINQCIIGGENSWEINNKKYNPNLSCWNGIVLESIPDVYEANQITIFETRVVWCRNWGLQFSKGSLLNIDKCTFEANGWFILSESNDLYNPKTGDPETGAIRIYPRYSPQINPSENYFYNFTDIINISNTWFERNLGYSIYCHYYVNDRIILNLNGNTVIAGDNKISPIAVLNLLYFGCYINLTPTPSILPKAVNIIGSASSIQLINGNSTFFIECDEANIIGSDLYSLQLVPNNQTVLKHHKI